MNWSTHMRVIPAIDKNRQVPVLDTAVMQHISYLFVAEEIYSLLHKRLKAGAAKYGTAWNEVDLTLDLEEEILDAMNYVAMASVRIGQVFEPPLTPEIVGAFRTLGRIAVKLEGAYREVKSLPRMEGPSSKDWLPMHGRDPAEAQAKFQGVVNE